MSGPDVYAKFNQLVTGFQSSPTNHTDINLHQLATGSNEKGSWNNINANNIVTTQKYTPPQPHSSTTTTTPTTTTTTTTTKSSSNSNTGGGGNITMKGHSNNPFQVKSGNVEPSGTIEWIDPKRDWPGYERVFKNLLNQYKDVISNGIREVEQIYYKSVCYVVSLLYGLYNESSGNNKGFVNAIPLREAVDFFTSGLSNDIRKRYSEDIIKALSTCELVPIYEETLPDSIENGIPKEITENTNVICFVTGNVIPANTKCYMIVLINKTDEIETIHYISMHPTESLWNFQQLLWLHYHLNSPHDMSLILKEKMTPQLKDESQYLKSEQTESTIEKCIIPLCLFYLLLKFSK